MQFVVGTSGYSYKEWKGSFYPEKLSQKKMLSYYSQRFASVEINSTFNGVPKAGVLESWAQQVPDGFRFVLKAPQTITHRKRLRNVDEDVDSLVRAASALQERLGPLLFQLPPNFKKDLPRLEALLGLVGKEAPTAFEFRHESWFADDVFDCLRANSCALCVADMDDLPCAELVNTASWGYVRLRRDDYTDQGLGEWIKRIKSLDWATAFVFFKHEDTGSGPRLAARFLELAAA